MSALFKIGLDLHNISTAADRTIRTGAQELTVNVIRAQAAIRNELRETEHVELIPLPFLPERGPKDPPWIGTTHINPTEKTLAELEKSLGLDRVAMFGNAPSPKEWTPRRYYEACKGLDWLFITGICDYRLPVARLEKLSPETKFATVIYDLVPIFAAVTTHPNMFAWFERCVLQSILDSESLMFAISRNTALDFHRYFNEHFRLGFDIFATPLPSQVPVAGDRDVDARRELLERYGLKERDYFICVGTIEPRKNLESALQAYLRCLELFPERFSQLKFVLVGGDGWGKTAEFIEKMMGLGRGGVIQTGYIPASEMEMLVSAACALAMPSRYEGFGLPLALARALGTNVVTCPTSSLPEASGWDAFFALPGSVDELALAFNLASQAPKKPAIDNIGLSHVKARLEEEWKELLRTWVRVIKAQPQKVRTKKELRERGKTDIAIDRKKEIIEIGKLIGNRPLNV